MFAAAISSLDTALNRNAAVLVRNILPFINRFTGRAKLTDDQEVLMGKTMTVVLGFAVGLIALFYSQMKGATLFDVFLNLGAIFSLPLFIPLVFILFIRKVPSWSALAALGAGFAVGFTDFVSDTGWSYQEKSFYVFAAGFGVYLFSMLFYRNTKLETREKWNAFYARMEKPVDFEEEVGHANDGVQLIQIGKFAVVLGSLIGLLLFLDNELWGRLCILGITAFVAGVGAWMWFAGIKADRRYRKLADS